MAARPTHFLSVRLPSKMLEAFGHSIRAQHPAFAGLLVEPGTAHLTLLLLQLNRDNEQAAIDCFRAFEPTFKAMVGSPQTLRFNGIGTFGSNVAVAKLTDLVAAARAHFAASGFTCKANVTPWTPHCTLMKTSRGAGPTEIPPRVYSDFAGYSFGESLFSEIDFCIMGGRKEPDGYYRSLGQLCL
ncbi:kinase A anchor protein [Entophlyctis helioformis]|nr:kinase A anchor protein [Entophlyctis helioformis]